MNLRYKIFLIIGGLFFIGFVVSQTLEEHITANDWAKEETALQKMIVEKNQQKKDRFKEFLRISFDEIEENIQVLMTKISTMPWLHSRFNPSIRNAKGGSWISAADLIDSNKWIDYFQNTNEGTLASQVVVDESFFYESKILKIDPSLTLAILKERNKDGWKGPYVLIPYDYEELSYIINENEKKDVAKNIFDNGYFLIFEISAIVGIDNQQLQERFNAVLKNWQNQGVTFDPASNFYQNAQNTINYVIAAQNYFKGHPELIETLNSSKRVNWVEAELENSKKCFDGGAPINEYDKKSRRFDLIDNIWELCSLLSVKILGDLPFVPTFPIGMMQADIKGDCGVSFFSEEVFFNETTTYAKEHKKFGEGDRDIVTRVFTDPNGHLYFGSIIALIDNDLETKQVFSNRTGTVSIAVETKGVVRNFALAMNAMTLFGTSQNILTGFNRNGSPIDVKNLPLTINQIFEKDSGFCQIEGVEYFFLKISPYENLDMNFYVFFPSDEEFSVINALKISSKNLIHNVAKKMNSIILIALLITLFCLNHIVKHITMPISFLASACESLGAGKLYEIKLPELQRKKHDEVYTLYHAFREMIDGLKEKDKVMGALNKVVAPSIAQEILKGKVHLGGEEKVITMLFADIRNFTKISEKMHPSDLIKMLNACMTKVSDVIDHHEGVIDKYVGDEVMALFGAPVPVKDPSKRAIECALEIHQKLKEWNKEREKQNLQPIEMGIGIHTGLVVLGNMGAENRLNYTALGANVNLAARLCSYAKAGEIIVSVNTLQDAGSNRVFDFQQLDPVSLKGFSESISIFKILGPKNQSSV